MYIRDHFKAAGLKLLGENGFQWFEIVTDVTLTGRNALSFPGLTERSKEFHTAFFFRQRNGKSPGGLCRLRIRPHLDSLK